MRRRREEGYTLVALMASVTIMLILMAASVPSWRYVMKNDAEEELIFRGGEIADAIARYQQKNGNALPPSLEVLVKARFLRKEYEDPMTKDGKWRLIRQGESIGPIRAPGAGGETGAAGSTPAGPGFRGAASLPGTSGSATTSISSRSATGRQGGTTLGGIQGVASTSEETSLRVFNGRTQYNEWIFLPGQPRVVGRPQARPGAGPGQPGALPGQPGARPGQPGRQPAQPARTLTRPGASPGIRR